MRPHLIPVREVNSAHEAMMAARDVIRRRKEQDRLASESIAAEERKQRSASLAMKESAFRISNERRIELKNMESQRHADAFLLRIDQENRGLYPAKSRIFAAKIMLWVAKRYGLTIADITGIRRTNRLVCYRRLAMCMVFHHRRTRNLSLPELGRIFCRDHTTILHAIKNSAAMKYSGFPRRLTHIPGLLKVIADRMNGDTWVDISIRYQCSQTSFQPRLRSIASGEDPAAAWQLAAALGLSGDALVDRLNHILRSAKPKPTDAGCNDG